MHDDFVARAFESHCLLSNWNPDDFEGYMLGDQFHEHDDGKGKEDHFCECCAAHTFTLAPTKVDNVDAVAAADKLVLQSYG